MLEEPNDPAKLIDAIELPRAAFNAWVKRHKFKMSPDESAWLKAWNFTSFSKEEVMDEVLRGQMRYAHRVGWIASFMKRFERKEGLEKRRRRRIAR